MSSVSSLHLQSLRCWRRNPSNAAAEKLLSQLKGADWDVFADALKPELYALKKAAGNRQTAAVDRLIDAVSDSNRPGTPEPSHASPTSLHVDVSSAGPTPVLTMEPNTPQSSGPPSTKASAAEETGDELASGKAALIGSAAHSYPEVDVAEH